MQQFRVYSTARPCLRQALDMELMGCHATDIGYALRAEKALVDDWIGPEVTSKSGGRP
jgi:hypothetical protein